MSDRGRGGRFSRAWLKCWVCGDFGEAEDMKDAPIWFSHAKRSARPHGMRGVKDRIWKWDAPEGDGNKFHRFFHRVLQTIWKWDAPEGDGNSISSAVKTFPSIWKWDAPEGDGNAIRQISSLNQLLYLEMRCPGRGRKQVKCFFKFPVFRIWKWDAPEGDGNHVLVLLIYRIFIWKWDAPEGDGNQEEVRYLQYFSSGYLEMRCPGRGRKLHGLTLLDFKLSCIWKWDAPEGDGNVVRRVGCEIFGFSIWKWDAPEGDGNRCISSYNPRLTIWKWDAPEGDGNLKRLSIETSPCDLEMRCPGRGRKLTAGKSREKSRCIYLEMRCPGRGRKLGYFMLSEIQQHIWKWDAPEGDGNCFDFLLHHVRIYLEMRCPGRGRKHKHSILLCNSSAVFGNEMPRKGTETSLLCPLNLHIDLEMRCPGRGRKLVRQEINN